MTYLPGLRASLVEAARQRCADSPEPQEQHGWRRRLNAGRVATALAAAVAMAVAALAIVALGNRPSGTSSGPTGAPTKSVLRQSARQLLGEMEVPPGAVASGLVPGTPAELWSPASGLAIPNHVDVYRVWRLPEAPDRVIAFIQKHLPPGSTGGTGSEETGTTAYVNGAGGSRESITYSSSTVIGFPGTPAGVWRQLALNAVSLQRGGTALRVDSQAGWLMPRPAGERIPSDVVRVQLSWTERGTPQRLSLGITNPGKVKAIVSLFNSLPPARTGTGVCKRAPNGFFRFAFDGPGQKAPLAVAAWAFPCQNLGLRIGAGPSVPIMAGSPTLGSGAEIAQVLAMILPPRRVSSSAATLNSSQQCPSSPPSTSARPRSEPGAAGGSCTSVSHSTTSITSR